MSTRVYTVVQLLDLLALPRRSFFALKAQGDLPFLEELKPRIGRCARYRADLVDRYLDGQWGRPRSFASHRRAS